jgi:2-polyprenyl-3-methyl-5-hydroxy-6-metoxy-1,4-benzoquinol methylase
MKSVSARARNEIEHGVFLAAEGPEAVWGWGSPAGRIRADRRGRLIAEGADLGPGKRVIEIGCGTGNFTEIFAQFGADIIAIDISPQLIELARRRAVPATVTWVCKRFEDAGIDGPFDAAIGSSVLHHLEIESAIAELHRLLKPGGVISFAEPNMLNPQIAIQKNVPLIKRRLGDSPDETAFVRFSMSSLLKRMGFEQVKIVPFDWLHPATPPRLISAVTEVGRRLEKLPGIREFSGSLLITARRN